MAATRTTTQTAFSPSAAVVPRRAASARMRTSLTLSVVSLDWWLPGGAGSRPRRHVARRVDPIRAGRRNTGRQRIGRDPLARQAGDGARPGTTCRPMPSPRCCSGRNPGGYILAAILLTSGVVHQVGYLVALPFQVAADVPGATAFDTIEPVIATGFLVAAVDRCWRASGAIPVTGDRHWWPRARWRKPKAKSSRP